ncbi:hypothetical protein NECAME_07235 [Necator americanus]|uniref:Uncharacterized protein n=1 Tax=Necator americanus TaxID=51031 RepID=W2TPQ8_NECAM|nr:hypothetical protein NECAME_07235 [Necator americanus]ETN83748.1 hypothetical protein NECAME_07235 [Necator americanus]
MQVLGHCLSKLQIKSVSEIHLRGEYISFRALNIADPPLLVLECTAVLEFGTLDKVNRVKRFTFTGTSSRVTNERYMSDVDK